MDDRLRRAAELTNLVRESAEVRMGVAAVLESTQCISIGHLAEEHPDLFDELHESMVDMMEQLPNTESLLPWR